MIGALLQHKTDTQRDGSLVLGIVVRGTTSKGEYFIYWFDGVACAKPIDWIHWHCNILFNPAEKNQLDGEALSR